MRPLFKYWNSSFDGSKSIRYKRWIAVQNTIITCNIEKVLEFGSGLSTILFDKMYLKVDSYETDKDYMELVREECSNRVNLFHWDNKNLVLSKRYDLALVDGVLPRRKQVALATTYANIVAIDDYRVSNLLDGWVRIDDEETIMAIFIRKVSSE